MAHAALAKPFGSACEIELIESEEIGIVGVGEATVPHLRTCNKTPGIDGVEFVRQISGHVQARDPVRRLGQDRRHVHSQLRGDRMRSGSIAVPPVLAQSAQDGDGQGHWRLFAEHGRGAGKFTTSASDVSRESPLAENACAYHFDAGLYARYLPGYSEARGVKRTEGKIIETKQRPGDGFVQALILDNGARIEALHRLLRISRPLDRADPARGR